MSEPRLTNLKLYLQRLGFDTPPAPTLDTLRLLQLRHTGAFPFENLATITGAPVLIDLPSIEQKVFDRWPWWLLLRTQSPVFRPVA